MRRFLARGLVALTGAWVGWSGSFAVAADPQPPESRSWYTKLNPFGEPPQKPGPRVRQPVAPLSGEALLAVMQAEKDAYTRRLDVCHRLREIALEKNDDKLEATANDLEKQATATYHTRVARLGVKGGGPLTGRPVSSPEMLDRTLGTGVAVNPLTAGAKGSDAGKTAVAKATPFKEVAP